MTGFTDAAHASETAHGRSREAASVLSTLLAVEPRLREQFMADLDANDLRWLLAAARRELGTPYGLWQDDPLGFAQGVIGQSLWSKQREVLEAVAAHRKVAVPAAFEVGKTRIGGVLVAWRGACWPPGASLTVTTATRMRQVNRQLWPHVRDIVTRYHLPGEVDIAQWKQKNSRGLPVVVAYGFSSAEGDETGAAGIHGPNLCLIVDEAGGIGRVLGESLRGVMAGEDTKTLLIGNPPTDDENSWFEEQCRSDTYQTITISAWQSPNLTGEPTGPCRACPEEHQAHPVARHLVDRTWVQETVDAHGKGSPFVVAKVDAGFPKGGSARAIPSTWVEQSRSAALLAAELGDATWREGWTHPPVIDLRPGSPDHGRPYAVQPPDGAWIRLGVDVASDGGDELAIARVEHDVVRIVHTSAGETNENAVDVAGKVLAAIREAEQVAELVGCPHPVRVKVDAIGLGWGVVSILEAWASEGMHGAQIVAVNVAERPERKADKQETFRPVNKRAEMWLVGRALLQPDHAGAQGLRLDVDARTAAQLSAPEYGTNSAGETVIERKQSMKSRGLPSPDRAEAVLLAVYEPVVSRRRRRVIG